MESFGWIDEVNFGTTEAPWLSMGLTRCDPVEWLHPDDQREVELAERRRLLAERHEDVFQARAGTEAAGAETLALVRHWFAAHRPDIALPADPLGAHPLEAAGRLVQEDLCLMVLREGAPHLDAACLCFPSHWRLADKFGRPAVAVHGPVPYYDTELAGRVDRYLSRLRPGVIGLRRNWSVHDSPTLFAPVPPRVPEPIAPAGVPERLWLRSERQTLRGLEAGAVLFTIRVQQAPFSQLAKHREAVARFADRLRHQPDALTAMNGLLPHRDAVLDWLKDLE
jgi:hypothetical protein